MSSSSGQSRKEIEARGQLANAYKLFKNQEYEEALRECDRAVETAPRLAAAHNLRGTVLEAMDRNSEAVAAYREAVRLDPTHPEAVQNLRRLDSGYVETVDASGIVENMPADLAEPQMDPVKQKEIYNQALQSIRSQQNIALGILGGAIAAIVGAVLWATITVVTDYQIGFMAIGVGFLVGFAVRWLGKGVDTSFGVVGAVLALLGCLLGNVLTIYALFSREFGVPLLDVITGLDMGTLVDIMVDITGAIDLLFYGLAIYAGYRYSFRRITVKDLNELGVEIPLSEQSPSTES